MYGLGYTVRKRHFGQAFAQAVAYAGQLANEYGLAVDVNYRAPHTPRSHAPERVMIVGPDKEPRARPPELDRTPHVDRYQAAGNDDGRPAYGVLT